MLIWILLYSGGLVLLGICVGRRVRRGSDFLVAGRRLGPGLVFATFLAANIGAGSTVGATALGYQIGWSAWWWVGSAGVGCLILANTVGPRLWRIAWENDYHTLGDYLAARYGPQVRSVIAIILWAGSLGLLAAQLVAISLVFQTVLGAPPWAGSVLAGIVATIYFTAGGLLSSAWINLLELTVLLAGFCLALPSAIKAGGGWARITAALPHAASGTADYLSVYGIGLSGVLYYVALLTPSFIVSPGLIQKVYGAQSARAARLGVNLNAVALLLFAAIPAALGIIAASQFPGLSDPQLALFKVMTDRLPPWLGILGIAAIFSAEISTCDAVLLMLSTSLAVDLYQARWNRNASGKDLLRAGRFSAALAGTLGVVIALVVPSIISSLTLFYSLVSVALFVPLIGGLYSRQPDSTAALSAILVSVPCTVIFSLVRRKALFGIINPFLLGMIVSFVVLWGVTWFRSRAASVQQSAGSP